MQRASGIISLVLQYGEGADAMRQVGEPRQGERPARARRRPDAADREGAPRLGLGFTGGSLPALQRTAGNRATVRLLAQAAVVQRLFSGYYVVCGPDAPGALLIDKDKQNPKRYYRTVASISAKAKKAPDQPFMVWTLYEDPEAASQPTVVPE